MTSSFPHTHSKHLPAPNVLSVLSLHTKKKKSSQHTHINGYCYAWLVYYLYVWSLYWNNSMSHAYLWNLCWIWASLSGIQHSVCLPGRSCVQSRQAHPQQQAPPVLKAQCTLFSLLQVRQTFKELRKLFNVLNQNIVVINFKKKFLSTIANNMLMRKKHAPSHTGLEGLSMTHTRLEKHTHSRLTHGPMTSWSNVYENNSTK